MKLAILSTSTYPSQMANRVHLFNMAKSFSRKAINVTLFAKSVEFGYSPSFKVRNFSDKKRCHSLVFSYIKELKKEDFDVIFIREPRVFFWYILFSVLLNYRSKKVIYEVHDMPRDWMDYLQVKCMSKWTLCMVTITHGLKEDICKLNKKLFQKTIVLPDAVDSELFDLKISVPEARTRLGLPLHKKIVVYTGSLYKWKGIDFVREVAERMPDVLFVFVGGRLEPDIDFYEKCKDLKNVKLIGYVTQEFVRFYMKAADVLVIANTAKSPLSNKYTSPLKLFEYMMSDKPIVASQTLAISEILNERNAFLCSPDDTDDLYLKIQEALYDSRALHIAHNAYNDVQQFTWDKRTDRLLAFMAIQVAGSNR